MKWSYERDQSAGGNMALYIRRLGPGGSTVNVTTFRGAPTQITSFSASDPFGDSTASFAFPSISIFDDLDAPDLQPWLAKYADVDLFWMPAVFTGDYVGANRPLIDPLTEQYDVFAPVWHRDDSGNIISPNRIKLWEGFIVDLSPQDNSFEIQCQGALFQLDHYLQKPFYPTRPWPLERLIRDAFAHDRKPNLRTQPMRTIWPAGWTKKAPKYTGGSANIYSPAVKPGTRWTGYTSRNTGSWEHALTGFVQDQLSNMIVDDDSGVTPGNQFTVQHYRASVTNPQGRQPVLLVRDRFRVPDFSVWVGSPGVACQISGDATQSENVVYGDGTDVSGETWRNAVIADDGSRTDYLPLAASRLVYPQHKNPAFSKHEFVSEAYVKFGAGFAQPDATTVARKQLARDQQPGWTGTITLSIDPSQDLPRWLIRPGMTVLLKGFLGSGAAGVPFHIASTEAAPHEGTMTLNVDTRYRDLLTVAEAQARTRDPLNPIRMLQVNKTSVMIEDIQAPWDYKAGSGFVPKASKEFALPKPNRIVFPYNEWAQKHPPLHHPHWYVKVNASAKKRKNRWAGPIPILTSEKGTISRSEFFCVDIRGNRVKAPFHVSLYYVNVTSAAMPRDGQGPSPYIDGAFESINPATGQAWPAGNFLAPDDKFIIGWGNRADGIYNRAGFSPGSEANGNPPTGLLADDSTWTFDNTSNPNYDRLAKPGQKQDRSAITLYAMFYAEWSEPIYFQGRLYRQNPGVS